MSSFTNSKSDVLKKELFLRFQNLTSAERNALVNPGPGRVIMNTTSDNPEIFNGLVWLTILTGPLA